MAHTKSFRLLAGFVLVLVLSPASPAAAIPPPFTPDCDGAVGDGGELVDAVAEANSNMVPDEITLAYLCWYEIPQTLVIGPDDASGTPQPLTITGVVEYGATINGLGTKRVIDVEPGAMLTLSRVQVIGGAAGGPPLTAAGGGIRNSGSAQLFDALLYGNVASGGGGAISNSGTMQITDSSITDNAAGQGGGAIHNSGALTLDHATLLGNHAGDSGGGIANTSQGTVTATHSTINGNEAGRGGAIDNRGGEVSVVDSLLYANRATVYGGAIYSDGDATVSRSKVDSNTAGRAGGGVYNRGTFDGIRSTFLANIVSAVRGGGAIYNHGGATRLSRSSLSSNQAPFGGAIANLSNSSTKITDSHLSFNRALGNGGGIHNRGRLTLLRTELVHNAALEGGGGALYNRHSARITRSRLVSNNAPIGGGVFNAQASSATIGTTLTESTVSGNVAVDGGGGIYNSGSLKAQRSFVGGNKATLFSGGNGAGIWADGNGGVTIVNSTIAGNQTATGKGGGIFATLSDGAPPGFVDLLHVTIAFNEAPAGSGLFREGVGGLLKLRNSIVARNLGGDDCSGELGLGSANVADSTACEPAAGFLPPVTEELVFDPVGVNGGPTWTFGLPADSPALGVATSSCPAVDQRNYPRQSPCDAGAYERLGP